MDWISAMEKYFKWDEMEYVKRVKFYCTNLKGNITIGCEQLQKERVRQRKNKIRMWNKKMSMIKGKFLPRDYEQRLFKDFYNLRQKERSVQGYIEEFYRVSIRRKHEEKEEKLVT